MHKLALRKVSLAVGGLIAIAGMIGGILASGIAHAEGEQDAEPGRISISISPVHEILDIKASSVYERELNVTNNGAEPFDFEVYSAPYSFALSQTGSEYGPDITSENNFTQIARWITIKDQAGNYVESTETGDSGEATHPVFSAAPGETVKISYRITTPENIPSGGQYATIFARTMPKDTGGSGINALANLGMKVFARSEDGEIIQSAEISELKIAQSLEEEAEVEENGQMVAKKVSVNKINGYALVKNTGNIDFQARGVLTVTSIFGGDPYYQTPDNEGIASVIPDSTMPVSDKWNDTPSFGLYRATWTVTAGDASETTEMIVCLISPAVIVIAIILLTIIIVWIIMMVRRRKERRSRFTV